MNSDVVEHNRYSFVGQPSSGVRHTCDVPPEVHLRQRNPLDTGWLERNYGWTDLTGDEIRCLTVLARYLAEANMRFYHLPLPRPQRFDNHRGFRFTLGRTLGSYDAPGLAALTVAAFAEHVRVEIIADMVSYPEGDVEFENPTWEYLEDAEDYGHVLAVRLTPRQPGAGLYDGHPGVEHLTAMIRRFTA